MAEPWVLVEPGSLVESARVVLDREEARHLVRVRRKGCGDAVELVDGAGRTAVAIVLGADRDRVELEVGDVVTHARPTSPAVDLSVGVLNGPAMDWVVQKAVEVGVRRLLPLVTARTQGGARASDRRRRHWLRVALQALKQCRRPWALEIAHTVGLADLVSGSPVGSIVAAADGRPPADLALDGAELMLVVGPEGGFTNSERCTMREAGWQHLRLAPHILRSETAATVGSAVLRLEWEARAVASDAARAISQGKVEPQA